MYKYWNHLGNNGQNKWILELTKILPILLICSRRFLFVILPFLSILKCAPSNEWIRKWIPYRDLQLKYFCFLQCNIVFLQPGKGNQGRSRRKKSRKNCCKETIWRRENNRKMETLYCKRCFWTSLDSDQEKN